MKNATLIRTFAVLRFTSAIVLAMIRLDAGGAAAEPTANTYVVPGAKSVWASGNPRAFPWPEPGRVPKATIKITETKRTPEQAHGLRIDYGFPDNACRQVVVDIPLSGGQCYGALTFALKGDGTANRIEVWLGAAGRWFGLGRCSLNTKSRAAVTLDVDEIDTDIAATLRFCIVQDGGLGTHTILLEDIRFVRPVEPRARDLHVFGKAIPAAVQALPARSREFNIRFDRNADRNVLLLDNEPLFCVLDARPDAAYLNAARQAGVNAFALDLYWHSIEPRKGYREWERLREWIGELGRLGFGVILMLGPHQPLWWRIEHPNVPGARDGAAFVLNPAVMKDFEPIVIELVTSTRDMPNVMGYMFSAGGEQDTSFSGPADDPVCLQQFRTWLRRHYDSVTALRQAWNEPKVQFSTAVPPSPAHKTDFSGARRDWRAFKTNWWVEYANYIAARVRPLAPDKLLVARFGWPVFQAENLFLSRLADVDLVQCKDAVAAWEVGHPGKQLSRTALYFGALRHSNQVVFPEMDIVHGRGYHGGDLSRYVPLFAQFAGALWYYRGLMTKRPGFLADFADAVARGKHLVKARPGPARTGVFYSVAWANWISVQRDYSNENALVGAAELLQESKLRFAGVSEFTLPDLFDFNSVLIPENPEISTDAEAALKAYIALGGAIVMEANTGEFDANGRRRSRGTPAFAPFRKSGMRRTDKRLNFTLHAPGVSGTLSLPGPAYEQGTAESGTEIVGRCAETAIVRSRTVLYIPCRFFAPYSYDTKADRSGMRRLIAAFLADVEPGQKRMAQRLVAEARKRARGKNATQLTALAQAALKDRLFVRAGFLARLSLAENKEKSTSGTAIPAALILRRSQNAWIDACRRRIQCRLKFADAVPGEAAKVRSALYQAETLQQSSRERTETDGNSAAERDLARGILTLNQLLKIERRLKNRSYAGH